MLTRRALLRTAAAAAASLVHAPRLHAAEYDLLITGGRVIDPAQGLDARLDVAIAGGRIADVRTGIAASDAAQVIDAADAVVLPGLVDLHAHVADPQMPPAHCLSTGVTALVDAGSRGADNVDDLAGIARSAPNRVRILLNLARRGLEGGRELVDLASADRAAARAAVERHRDLIVGIKLRVSRPVVGTQDLEAIRLALEVARPLRLPLMVHIGQSASPLPAILALLRPGDIVTHVYAPAPNGILDGNGRLLGEVRDGRRRGILFDVGNGRNGHITWEVADRALQQDFLPDTISSDLTAPGRTDRVFDFPTVLSKFLVLGMPLDRVVACATVNAARALPAFEPLGTLRRGAPADVAIFDLRDGEFEFVDNLNARRTGRQKLFPRAVIAGGRRVA